MRVSVIAGQYRARLRRQLVAELLAAAGIAVGVALVFGVLIASSSVTGPAASLIRAVTGSAQLELAARSPEGISESLAQRAGAVSGVKVATFLLRDDATLVGSKRRRAIQLIGITPNIVALGGSATRDFSAGQGLLSGGIGMPAEIADDVGAHAGGRVAVLAGGRSRHAVVRAVLNAAVIGPVAEAPVAVALLPVAQQLTGQRGRVTEVLLKVRAGQVRRVAAELRTLVAGRASVTPASNELRVLEATAKPLEQSTSLFVVIAAMVGLLFACNAMLLTLPERRRMVIELHTQGFDLRQIQLILVSQAMMTGLVGSLAGLAFGELLAHTLFEASPVYLAAAFPVTVHQSASVSTVLLALAGGLLAAVLASVAPMLDLRAGRPLELAAGGGESAQRISQGTIRDTSLLGAALVIVASLLALISPSLTIVAGVLLALATPLLIPAIFTATVACVRWLGARTRGSLISLPAVELNATATRSVALIGVAALACFGAVAVQGARSDLTQGLDRAVAEYLETANIWVAQNNNFLTIDSFSSGSQEGLIRKVPGVATVRPYQGELLDIGQRRLWIRARAPGDRPIIQASQLLHGNLARASARVRAGGWAAISNQFAQERNLRVGSSFTLPSPSGPAALRVAAITTNVGWSPGAITINTATYRRYWRTRWTSAWEVTLRQGVSPVAAKRRIESALSAYPGLRVETRRQREASFTASARAGLHSLGEIAILLLIAAALAVAAVLGASLWQRRARLAALKVDGFAPAQLWRALVFESTIAITVGCLDGAIIGAYGHLLASRWLAATTGFPAPFALHLPGVLLTLAIVIGITVLAVAIPGLAAARVPPSVSFQDQT